MSVKWRGVRSEPRKINGGWPQGATFGILGYLSQSNGNANMVEVDDRFKFIDDLSLLELIELCSVGIMAYNLNQHVPTDVPTHNQIIPAENLKSQAWLNQINQWTEDHQMLLNAKKTKCMIFNYTDNYQFTTRLKVKGETIEVLRSTKLLGTIISDDLKWDLNTQNIVLRANSRMELLRRVASFGASVNDLKNIYFLFIRSLLEQSAPLWHSSLSQENRKDIERIQKSAMTIILGHPIKSYKKALIKLNMESLEDRREYQCLQFAIKCTENPKLKSMFPENDKIHEMKTRNVEKFKVQHAKTSRLQSSAIIYMQGLLNSHAKN